MLRMLRRYRFLILALFMVLVVYKAKHLGDLAPYSQTSDLDFSASIMDEHVGSPIDPPVKPAPPTPLDENSNDVIKAVTANKGHAISTKANEVLSSVGIAASTTSSPNASTLTLPTLPTARLPHRKKPPLNNDYGMEYEDKVDIHPIGQPGRQDLPSLSTAPTTIHWEKQVEHFPVPIKSLIHLPIGKPVQIPKLQHEFNDETVDAKITREKRQTKVKEEFKKAWKGYKEHAWLHDELSPVSGKFRDPFCGWAATLVDGLDTLWIMGLEEEFEEAAKAVDLLDFTTSVRDDIPMFETTIRYLGGLISAYDVSGGRYKNLLDKAVELADILMGAFDTPNRMPVLYYRWKPAFASQPHRASQRSNTAELGSLSMEFTRLAQLTQDHRYYDAIARVTNALSEWQDRGTQLDGVFPDDIDASGCNHTVANDIMPEAVSSGRGPATNSGNTVAEQEPVGYQPSNIDVVAEPQPKKKQIKGDPDIIQLQVLAGEPGKTPSKAQIFGWDDQIPVKKTVTKRNFNGNAIITNRTTPVIEAGSDHILPLLDEPLSVLTDPETGLPVDIQAAKAKLGASVGDWDCPIQGLEPGSSHGPGKFGMGGGQDSTYEYLPKQYLLLGGLEEKYAKMYLKTIEAIRKWMLYRPMIPGGHDILFSGSVTTSGDPQNDLRLNAEVEHLTCFIGGMVGMGAKIFGIEDDLEIAKKLTDGCFWAYEMTPSGIMPEASTVMPCESIKNCPWNETAYWEYLDPMADQRDKLVEEYITNKATRETEMEAERIAAVSRAEAERTNAEEADAEIFVDDDHLKTHELTHGSGPAPSPLHSDTSEKESSASLKKREIQGSSKGDRPKLITHDLGEDVPVTNQMSGKSQPESKSRNGDMPVASLPNGMKPKPTENIFNDASKLTEMASGRQADAHAADAPSLVGEALLDPLKPLSHKEWVETRIKQEALPPGFVTLRGRKYILRPEAIESVWYMYRITGDTTWQDKGWKMFESIIKATSTEYGHSAIYDVTIETPYQVDEMESFWLAETLKYFYLLYSTPDIISLDEWVLNTEAHPFKRLT